MKEGANDRREKKAAGTSDKATSSGSVTVLLPEENFLPPEREVRWICRHLPAGSIGGQLSIFCLDSTRAVALLGASASGAAPGRSPADSILEENFSPRPLAPIIERPDPTAPATSAAARSRHLHCAMSSRRKKADLVVARGTMSWSNTMDVT